MSRRFFLALSTPVWRDILLPCVMCCFMATTLSAADGDNSTTKQTSGTGVFGLTKVWSIDLEVTSKEYEAMQPRPPAGFGPPGGPGAPPPAVRNPGEKRDSERNLFGTEFPWAHADLSTEGKNYKNIGVRYSGEITYFASAQILKRPLKLEFNKFGDQEFHGLTSFQLHAMPMDPAKGREIIAYSIFQASGVPSQRTGFAEITLTVPGKFDKEPLGLYLIVENVDQRFLLDRFGTDQGLLMKPFQVRSVEYLGEDFERYKGQYRPQSEATKEQSQRIISFAKLVHQSSDDEFKKEIDSYLDLDAFLTCPTEVG
jgi:spore coat protein H